jgi:hypothetical protein
MQNNYDYYGQITSFRFANIRLCNFNSTRWWWDIQCMHVLYCCSEYWTPAVHYNNYNIHIPTQFSLCSNAIHIIYIHKNHRFVHVVKRIKPLVFRLTLKKCNRVWLLLSGIAVEYNNNYTYIYNSINMYISWIHNKRLNVQYENYYVQLAQKKKIRFFSSSMIFHFVRVFIIYSNCSVCI